MIIKPSTALRNNYLEMSKLAHKTKEPIYITRNGEGDLVLMSMEAFAEKTQMLEFRANVLEAEEQRIRGAETKSVADARAAFTGYGSK